MVHHTKDKGDLATVKVIADLTNKGFVVFSPVVCEHLPFDLIGYRDKKSFRFQSKYRENGEIKNKTTWADKNGSHERKYSSDDFDYYAIYIPEKDVICYPSIKFGGSTLATIVPNSPTPFYWYEDFLDLTDCSVKKTYRDFGFEITRPKTPKPEFRKVIRPSREDLEKLIWNTPMKELSKQFGVSDKAIAKWAKGYGLETPGRGYWNKHS